MNPKAFVSHAGEDIGFAEPFAKALRENGVDAWLDKWETRAGDSLPQKMFGALDEAEYVIAVLSRASIQKPWVTAELDLAVVKRIEGEARIIPVNLGLERREIPAPLRAIKWVSVPDPSNFQAALGEVLDAIYQRSKKPPLGPAPGFTDVAVPDLPNLTHSDTVTLKVIFERLAEEDADFLLDTEIPRQRTSELGISEQAFMESLDVLRAEGYLEFQKTFGGGVPTVKVTWYAVETCCRTWIPNYEDRLKRILAEVVNQPDEGKWSNRTLANELKEPFWLVTHVFDGLAAQGLITVSQSFIGYRRLWVVQVSPQLKRKLRE